MSLDNLTLDLIKSFAKFSLVFQANLDLWIHLSVKASSLDNNIIFCSLSALEVCWEDFITTFFSLSSFILFFSFIFLWAATNPIFIWIGNNIFYAHDDCREILCLFDILKVDLYNLHVICSWGMHIMTDNTQGQCFLNHLGHMPWGSPLGRASQKHITAWFEFRAYDQSYLRCRKQTPLSLLTFGGHIWYTPLTHCFKEKGGPICNLMNLKISFFRI